MSEKQVKTIPKNFRTQPVQHPQLLSIVAPAASSLSEPPWRVMYLSHNNPGASSDPHAPEWAQNLFLLRPPKHKTIQINKLDTNTIWHAFCSNKTISYSDAYNKNVIFTG